MATQKNIAQTLDRCAARAFSVDAEPATSKQCWFLASLILKAGEDGTDYSLNTSLVLSKNYASELIDVYLGGR